MKEINLNNYNRKNTFEWFNSFSNSTYGLNAKIDVSKLVKHSKENNQSFFINMLYIVTKTLNEIPEFRSRLYNNKPVIFDKVTPAYTVMTKSKDFENVRHDYIENYNEFYQLAKSLIEKAKNYDSPIYNEYNPESKYNELYITCLPWINFTEMSHPIPDDKNNQCIPRICWGKFSEANNMFELTLNITVSHIFIDGYQLSLAFNNIQEMINNLQNILI